MMSDHTIPAPKTNTDRYIQLWNPLTLRIGSCTTGQQESKRERCSYFLLDEANLHTAAKVRDKEEEEEEKRKDKTADIAPIVWVKFGGTILRPFTKPPNKYPRVAVYVHERGQGRDESGIQLYF